MTNDERNTDEMKNWIDQYEEELRLVFDAQMEIVHGLRNVSSSKIIDPEDKDSYSSIN
jgi:hypothetical protein